MLFRDTLRGFGLNEEYNGYWPIFDTEAMHLHNVIHYLFQSPRNLFRQIGFLLYAKTSYQVSAGPHYQYLKRHHPQVDGTYFSEHAHIDMHHSRMVIDEVVKPLVARFGAEVGEEVILGAELTRRAFAAADGHALAVGQPFEAARLDGAATFAAPRRDAAELPQPQARRGPAVGHRHRPPGRDPPRPHRPRRAGGDFGQDRCGVSGDLRSDGVGETAGCRSRLRRYSARRARSAAVIVPSSR